MLTTPAVSTAVRGFGALLRLPRWNRRTGPWRVEIRGQSARKPTPVPHRWTNAGGPRPARLAENPVEPTAAAAE